MNRFLTTASCAAILLLSACSSSEILDEITEVAGGPDNGGSGGSDTGGTGSGGTGDTGSGGTGGTGTGGTGTGGTGTGGSSTGTGGTGTSTGGGNGSNTGASTGLIPMPVFGGAGAGTIAPAILATYNTALGDAANAVLVGVIGPSVVSTGAATFNGAMGLSTSDTETIVGNFTMNANFGNSTATARATDFARYVIASGAPISSATIATNFTGALSMPDGVISGNSVSGNLAGTLNDGFSDFATTTTLQGNFYDNGANSIFFGTADGSATELSSGFSDPISASIIATD